MRYRSLGQGGGNQQPFIVILADDTQDAGAGLALSISQSNNTFERGDIVEVSLSDASAQLFSGLLQVSTHNEPMLVGRPNRWPRSPSPQTKSRSTNRNT